ncbi:MAG: FAD synthetase family protein [Spirochaetia bacterium]
MGVYFWQNNSRRKILESPHSFCIGVFDGVHRGHQTLIEKTVNNGQNLAPGVITFDPNPAQVFQSGSFPGLIQSINQRIQKFTSKGLEDIIIIPFSTEFSQIPGVDFLDLLLSKIALEHLVIGSNFHCGRNMDTDSEDAAAFLRFKGVRVDIVPPVVDNGIPISSTRIRNLILAGRVDQVIPLMDSPYILEIPEGCTGTNTAGAVLKSEIRQVLPAQGEYSGCIIDSRGKNIAWIDIYIDEKYVNWYKTTTEAAESERFKEKNRNYNSGLVFLKPVRIKKRSREHHALNKGRKTGNY